MMKKLKTKKIFKSKSVNRENTLLTGILFLKFFVVYLPSLAFIFLNFTVHHSPLHKYIFQRLSFLIACIFFFIISPSVEAQTSQTYKGRLKAAENAEKNIDPLEAALNYERAWQLQPQKYDVLLKAAELYKTSRDYSKAVQCYKILSAQPVYAFTRLDYARALQQSGQYDEAIPEYLLYLNSYEKKDRGLVADKIETYIAGCTKGIRETDTLSRQKDKGYSTTDIKVFSGVQNMSSYIQSPIIFNDDILYFVNRTQKDTTLKRAQWMTDDWSQSESVTNMTTLIGGNLESGCFSASGNIFYFSRKSDLGLRTSEVGGKIKGNVKTSKSGTLLYAVERVNDTWSPPILLNENVNDASAENTQPCSFEKDGFEWLFFSSNRQNGSGGMDIWFTRKAIKAPLRFFEKAQNCGKIINTEGDEITPFYDTEENTLYFSSDGRAVFGGFDIFKSKGWLQRWLTPENIGLPYNSPADDIYFRMNKSRTFSLIVSNRLFGLEKINTHTDDLFTFISKTNGKDFYVEGHIFDKSNGNLLKNERVTLYESIAGNQESLSGQNPNLKSENRLLTSKKLLISIISNDGLFRFPVFSNKFYNLEVEKDSFNLKNINFSTDSLIGNVKQPLFLDKTYYPADYTSFGRKNSKNKSMGESQERYSTAPDDSFNENEDIVLQKNKDKTKNLKNSRTAKNETASTGKMADSKINFKVQILAYEEMDWSVKKRLIRVEDIGDFVTEKSVIKGKNFTRVLFKNNASYSEALAILRKVKNRSISDAFIVKYENGLRVENN